MLDRASGKAISVKKLGMGAHNHFAQSFSAKTGLTYVPTTELTASNVDGDAPADAGKSALVAWDPVKQQPLWVVPTPGAFSGGVLSTAGELVFQGHADGYLTAYSAADGRRAWAFYTATAALGAPISFAIGKRQYISILNGPTQGTAGSLGAMSARFGWDSRAHPRRLLTFVLDGTGSLPPTPGPTTATPVDGGDLVVEKRWRKRARSCSRSVSGATAQARSPAVVARICGLRCRPWWKQHLRGVVRGGNEARGMPKFEDSAIESSLVAALHTRAGTTRHATRRRGATGA